MPTFNQQTTIQEIAAAYPGAIERKTYLISGGTNGLGLYFAKFIAQHGAGTVVITGRSEERLAKSLEDIKSVASSNSKVIPLFLNLESQDSVRRAAQKVTSGELGIPKIDVLINNAGISGVSYKKIDGHESQFVCNHLSHFHFTNLILPHIKSPGGRIISATSVGHRFSDIRFDDLTFRDGETYNKWAAYGQSKTANILFAMSLTKRLSESKGIQAYSVHPGYISETGIFDHLNLLEEGFVDQTGKWIVPDMITPDQGIATYLYASLSPELDGKGGSYLTKSQIWHTEFTMTGEVAEKTWDLSNKILGTTF